MSYERSFSRGRGRGRGGFNDSGGSRNFNTNNKYDDRSSKDDFSDRGFRTTRRPMGNFTKSYSRDEYRPRDDRRDSYERESFRRDSGGRRDPRERLRGRDREFGSSSGSGNIRRSPQEYRGAKDLSRSRALSPPRKEYSMRDISPRMGRDMSPRMRDVEPRMRDMEPRIRDMDPRFREYMSRSRNFEGGRSRDARRDYSPTVRDRHHFSPPPPVRYHQQHDRYDYSPPPQSSSRNRNFERDNFIDRRRSNEGRSFNPRETREYRSRSPNTYRPRGGRFNSQRGNTRGRDNINRFESNQRSNFNRSSRDQESSMRRGHVNDNPKRKVEQVINSGIPPQKKSRDSSFETSP